MGDKRRAHRLQVELPAVFQIRGDDSNPMLASTVDLSALGICMEMQEKPDIGQELTLKVSLPDKTELSIHAQVVWVEEINLNETLSYKSGIKIIDEMRGDEAKFIQFYAQKLKEMEPRL